MRKDVNFFLRYEAEQFAQFILRIYQLVHDILLSLLLSVTSSVILGFS